jgi:hypothetical protein
MCRASQEQKGVTIQAGAKLIAAATFEVGAIAGIILTEARGENSFRV